MDPIYAYIMFAVGVIFLTTGLLTLALTIKKYSKAGVYLCIALNAIGAVLGLWALLQIIPPAFGIH
jgi:uncharacterized membrane protein HdeD (DUF308 family)